MIIARLISRSGDGTEALLLGLTRKNIEELLKGNPMHLSSETHGAGIPLGWTIEIVFGETELDLARDLHAAGGIGPETSITALPGGPDHLPRKQ